MPVIPPRPLKGEPETLYRLALVIQHAIPFALFVERHANTAEQEQFARDWLNRVQPMIQVLIEQCKHAQRMNPTLVEDDS